MNVLCGLEILRIATEVFQIFEVFHLRSKKTTTHITHQGKLHNKVLCLVQTMEEYEKPFSCCSEELYALDSIINALELLL